MDTCQVNHIYFDYEQERLSKFFFLQLFIFSDQVVGKIIMNVSEKLEICKLIRKHILTSELVQRSESVSPTRFMNVDHTSRLTQQSRGDQLL